MNCPNYHSLVNSLDSFPPLPVTVTRVLEVVNEPESSAKDMMQAILPDQSMCIAILKVANSAFFGRPKEVSSIETAVMVLGFNEIQSIILGKAVFDSFNKHLSRNSHVDQFWRNSFNSGLAAKALASRLALSPGNLFIAGLIHDIGKLALLITFPHDYELEICSEPGSIKETLEKEQQQFGMSHDKVAARLFKRWFFPESLTAAVEFHHAPQLAAEHQKPATAIALADIFSFLLGNPGKLEDRSFTEIISDGFPELATQSQALQIPWQDDFFQSVFDQLLDERASHDNLASIIPSG